MLNDSTEVGMKLECNMDIYMYISLRYISHIKVKEL